MSPFPFQVTNVQRLTADAIQIDLEAPESLTTFTPGQFLTLTVEVDGTSHRRAYSIWSTPESLPRLSIAVKRVPHGVVSGHLHDHVKAGDTLLARGPAGLFAITPNPVAHHIVAFAAGSGITPILSIVQSVLRNEPDTQIDLVYGNRHEHTILFRDLLDALASSHGDRFRLHHVLSQPSESWQGATGRVNESTAATLLEDVNGSEASSEYLLCGPDPMMRTLSAWLDRRGVPASRIRQERFLSPRPDSHRPRPSSPQPATYRIHGISRDVLVPPSKTVLQAGLDAGMAMGHSCAMGGCGACKVKLRRGSVYMDEPNALTASEREAGNVLACIAYAQEPIEVESP
jgi:ferredoxin-NADP reductase